MTTKNSLVETARRLIQQNTINPPGNEAEAANYVGHRLEHAGFKVAFHQLGAGRTSLIADLDGSGSDKPLCFTGHLDTVPLGSSAWTVDPFAAEISDGKLFGRGSTDMKGGIAAIVEAAIRVARRPARRALKLVFTAGEETGCEGAAVLAQSDKLGNAGAIVVAEPSSNRPLIGHRGVLWLRLCFEGRTAHGSMPHLGDNAVIKAAHAIIDLDNFDFNVTAHDHLGLPSLSVGYCHGGTNINSVPDHAEIGLDIRTIPGQAHDQIFKQFASQSKTGPALERIIDLEGVFTSPNDEWIQYVFETTAEVTGERTPPDTAPYFTDASILTPAYRNPPTIILGPGAMDQAHATDEFCEIEKLRQAMEIYERISVS